LWAQWVATAVQPGHHVHHLFDDLVGKRHQLLVLLAPLRHFVVQGVLRQGGSVVFHFLFLFASLVFLFTSRVLEE
jgi:hypothetical protein